MAETRFTGVPDAKTQEEIRQVLLEHWHPIREAGATRSSAEYDLFVGPLYRFLKHRCKPMQIARWLWGFHSNSPTWSTEDPSALLHVAEELLALEVCDLP